MLLDFVVLLLTVVCVGLSARSYDQSNQATRPADLHRERPSPDERGGPEGR